jgi:zinc protease
MKPLRLPFPSRSLAGSAFLALSFLGASVAPALGQSKPVEARKWEHERSDIPADPRIHFGRLDNGMRYAWMKNVEPKQRCYLRLHVDVGSLAEKDDERGMAHYLEHMAFNGSRHYPAGTLIEWFQKHGMAFGADTNASTSFSETVYQIDLPTSD